MAFRRTEFYFYFLNIFLTRTCAVATLPYVSSSECYPMANVHEGTKDKTAFIAATLCDSEQLMSRRAEE